MGSRCIYCGHEGKLSGEHYLPRCLDTFKGFEQLLDKICAECNNDFMKLEEQLCRSGPEAFFREMLDIKGRKGHQKVSPFYRGSAGGGRLILKGKPLGEDLELDYELNRGTQTVTHLRQI